ncbi:MAG: (d)CMP kinase [Hyphomicrobiaceae bacterium]|nr:(d)CMP kinase [Hyphomicrobiaceae bacterium]
MIIAIDGPAASGKGTLARQIAKFYGYAYLDTGLLYRSVARDIMSSGGSLELESDAITAALSIDLKTLSDPNLHLAKISEAASIVALHPGLRKSLLEIQRFFVKKNANPGAVLDGRDIGTVVCPTADVKLFITADINVRAKRRYLELDSGKENIELELILNSLKERDSRDFKRNQSPLRLAEDALLLDTTNLDSIEVFEAADELIKRKISQQNS